MTAHLSCLRGFLYCHPGHLLSASPEVQVRAPLLSNAQRRDDILALQSSVSSETELVTI